MLMAPVIGYRGCAGHAPENTLAGIRDAARVGCKWVEVDATLLKDGTVVLFHDDSLNRCTNGSGFIQNKKWADLIQYDAGSWHGKGQYVGERVPLLFDALKCCQAVGLSLNIELKVHQGEGVDLAKAVYKIIADSGFEDALISSYDRSALNAIDDDISKGLICNKLPDDWMDVTCQSIHLLAENVRPYHIEAVKISGRDTYVFTVNEKADARRFYDMGVDGVFSDLADQLLSPCSL